MSAESFKVAPQELPAEGQPHWTGPRACEWCGDQLHHHEPLDEQFCAGQLAAWKRITDDASAPGV